MAAGGEASLDDFVRESLEDDGQSFDASSAFVAAPPPFSEHVTAMRDLAGSLSQAVGAFCNGAQDLDAEGSYVLNYDCGALQLAEVAEFRPRAARGANFMLKMDDERCACRLELAKYYDPASLSPPSDGAWLYLRRT